MRWFYLDPGKPRAPGSIEQLTLINGEDVLNVWRANIGWTALIDTERLVVFQARTASREIRIFVREDLLKKEMS